jgi:hypothetical protein
MKTPLALLAIFALSTGAIAAETPTTLALARDVVSATKADQSFENIAAQLRQSANNLIVPPAGATPEQVKKAGEIQAKVVNVSVAAAKDMSAKLEHVYADVYSESELRAMKVFFSSAAGQSMLTKQSQLMSRLIPQTQELQRDLTPKIRQIIEEARSPGPAPAAK